MITPKKITSKKLTNSSDLNSWNSEQFPTMTSSYDFCQRISFILQKLREESWLPEILRRNISEKCGHILELSFAGKLDEQSAKEFVESLATTSYEFEELTLQSNTLCQIRTLDLELNNHLRDYAIRSEAV